GGAGPADAPAGRPARRGRPRAALACPASVARAVSPLTVLATARAAARFAAGVGEPTRAAALANGALSMTATHLKLGLLLAVTLAVVGLGVAGTRTPEAPPAASPRDAGLPPLAAARPPVAAPQAEFEEVTVVIKPGGLSNRTRETVRVLADGTCVYDVPERPARGEILAWPAGRNIHKLPPDRLAELNTLLKGTDWLTKDAKAVMQLHQYEYQLSVKRDGKTT